MTGVLLASKDSRCIAAIRRGRDDEIKSDPAYPELPANWTYRGHRETDAIDPKQTLRPYVRGRGHGTTLVAVSRQHALQSALARLGSR